MTPRELLTPKQVAQAIGVSESSLKRWCDRGALPTVRTVGGHRRLPLNGVLKFLQETGQTLVQPELLGLPPRCGQTPRSLTRAAEELLGALLEPNDELARRILFDLYLAGHRLATIFDHVVQPAFQEIGACWVRSEIAPFEERTACEIAQRILHELRLAWNLIDPLQPVALGGTLAGDEYRIPTSMVELVLLECRWRAFSLGTNLPAESYSAAILKHRPALVWLSISTILDPDRFLHDYALVAQATHDAGVPLVIGGQALDESLRRQIRFTTFCENMQQLESFAETWLAAAGPPALLSDATP
ncbi:MAG TPA: helix-turn-helix domain-containing protein [Planctomycetaceae bacterium]|nr:helix-turn-helix domain-containing protein [Planctomycetaceae bacterium]